MSANGCGIWGEFTKAWAFLFHASPPFEACCDEHDLAYEQVETAADKAWADEHLRRCMAGRGWPVLGAVFQVVVTLFGWIAIFRERLQRAWPSHE